MKDQYCCKKCFEHYHRHETLLHQTCYLVLWSAGAKDAKSPQQIFVNNSERKTDGPKGAA